MHWNFGNLKLAILACVQLSKPLYVAWVVQYLARCVSFDSEGNFEALIFKIEHIIVAQSVLAQIRIDRRVVLRHQVNELERCEQESDVDDDKGDYTTRGSSQAALSIDVESRHRLQEHVYTF